MTSRHYDVVVLGRSLGTLAVAAMLARRDFSVLLLGQGQRAPSYEFERFRLGRRAFTLLFGASPVWKRILQDLAVSPTFRRRLKPLEPMFSLAAEKRRLAISSQPERFDREIQREFPEVRQLVDELYQRLAGANAAIDAAFSRDIVWPPGTLMEKMESGRVAGTLPFTDAEDPNDLLFKFPEDHPYRELATLPAVFGTDLDYSLMGLPPLAFARLSGSWTRGLMFLPGGEAELESFLLERFRNHGGVTELEGSVEHIGVRGGRVNSVQINGLDSPLGTDAVISSLSGEALANMAGGAGITKKARAAWPEVTPTAGRFVVSMVVKREALPEPLSPETFLLPPESPYPNPRQPVVHLQRHDLKHDPASGRAPESQLICEALVPAEGALTLSEARAAVMSTVTYHLPFIERHLMVLDSPHDGLPLLDYSSGAPKEIDRLHVKQSSTDPEFMDYQWSVEPPGLLGLAGEPLRGPIKGTYLVGKTTLPALGQEGELLAAWGVARILTRRDSSRQKRRRQLWTKIETG
jgi:phytoene dehydrogenase-like protein